MVQKSTCVSELVWSWIITENQQEAHVGHSQWLLTQMITQHLLKCEEQPTGHQDQNYGKVEHTRLLCHHDPPIAVELVPAWEDLPLSLHSPLLGVWGFHGWGVMMGADLIVLTFPAVIQSKMHVVGLVYSSANTWFKITESQNVCMQRRHVEKHRSWWTDGENVCVIRAKEMTVMLSFCRL